MHASRPLSHAATPILRSAARPAAARRRTRRADSSLPALVPPSRDLIGPPCPLSNLRPVHYAPLFPSSSSTANSLTHASPHPYSLSEFPTASSRREPRLARLDTVRRRLAEQDLAWRLTRYRLDAFNQEFWTRHNAQFLRAREDFLSSSSTTSTTTSSDAAPTPADVDLAGFYAAYLERTRTDYARYNAELWRLQGQVLVGAVRASLRRARWTVECWRAGVPVREA